MKAYAINSACAVLKEMWIHDNWKVVHSRRKPWRNSVRQSRIMVITYQLKISHMNWNTVSMCLRYTSLLLCINLELQTDVFTYIFRSLKVNSHLPANQNWEFFGDIDLGNGQIDWYCSCSIPAEEQANFMLLSTWELVIESLVLISQS